MRSRKPGRLGEIAAAARLVFTRQGWRLTQMADVAREAGVSTGSLYAYVDGKEALFELALVEAADGLDEAAARAERFAPIGLDARMAAIRAARFDEAQWPMVVADAAAGPAAVGAALGELHDRLGPLRRLIWLLDRCAGDAPGLDLAWQGEIRGRYIAHLTRLVAGATGDADLDRAEVRARALMEMTVWMAMHRHRDPRPPSVDEATARATVIEIGTASAANWRAGGA
jgi:AcrR family transcriptional regulator